MTNHKDKHHDNRPCNDIIRTHTFGQAVEHTGKDTTRKSQRKQADIGKDIAQQTGSHVVAIPQTQTDIYKDILIRTVIQENHQGCNTQNHQMDSTTHRQYRRKQC